MTKIVVTYADYAALPNDGKRWELHEGDLSVTPAPGPRHQIVSGNLYTPLHGHVKGRRLGIVLTAPLDVILSDVTVVQPDIVFIDNQRLGAITDRGVEGPPTLAVEILSPSSVLTDRVTKPSLYARYGVPYFWLVDAEGRSIEAFVLRPEGYELVVRATGATPVVLPPFPDLALVPESLWP